MPDFDFKKFNERQTDKASQAAQLSGLTQAFQEFVDIGPSVLELQRAVLTGAIAAQQREAESGLQNDEIKGQAAQRAEKFQNYLMQWEKGINYADKYIDTVTVPGLFHGYVMQLDQKAAQGYTVKLKAKESWEAKTDVQGYFRMTFGEKKNMGNRMKQFFQRAEPDLGNRMSEAMLVTGQSNDVAVEILDPKGEVVLRDTLTSPQNGKQSEFKFYVLEF